MRYALILFLSPFMLHGQSKLELDNWMHWRGPLRNGTAPKADPPLKWDQKTNIKWKVPVPGKGTSTPIILNDRIFLLTAIDTGKQARPVDIPKPDPRFRKLTRAPKTYHQYVVLCLGRKTGKTLWKKVATTQVPHEGHHPTHCFAAFSPTTDGKHLYVSFGSRGVFCYDLDGNLKWKRSLGLLHTRKGWGEATSPVIYKDVLIVNNDHEGDSMLFVLNAKDGTTKWKKPRDEVTSWATPLVVEHEGVTQLIVHGTDRVRGYDLKTGKVLWACGGQTVNAIPCPVAKDGVVYCMSGYRGSLAVAIPLSSRGDITGKKKIVWRHERGTPYVPSPLSYGDRLYFTARNQGLLSSLDVKTGKVLIDRARLPESPPIYASPVAAKDRIYIVGRDGTTIVLKHGDKMKVLAVNHLEDPIDASPVLVGKHLFLRGEKYLYCIGK